MEKAGIKGELVYKRQIIANYSMSYLQDIDSTAIFTHRQDVTEIYDKICSNNFPRTPSPDLVK